MSTEVAQEIARQIGAKAFMMMGTKSKFADGDALIFDIKGSPKWNKVKVTLNAMDTYDITFYKVGRAPAFKVTSETVEGVYVEDMHATIERETGLYLSIGNIYRGAKP